MNRVLRKHGTTSKYNAGCRCKKCRTANAEYKLDWRMRRRRNGLCETCHRKNRRRNRFGARLGRCAWCAAMRR